MKSHFFPFDSFSGFSNNAKENSCQGTVDGTTTAYTNRLLCFIFNPLSLFLFIFFLGGFLRVGAQVTRTSVSSGNWATGSVWSPAGLPGASDNLIISPGHTITYNNAANYSTSGIMTVSGALEI